MLNQCASSIITFFRNFSLDRVHLTLAFDFSFFKTRKPDAAAFSVPVLDVCPDILELREDLGEEGGLGVDPEHGLAQLVDDVDAAVPELVLVRLDEERFQGVADLVTHVAGTNGQGDTFENWSGTTFEIAFLININKNFKSLNFVPTCN